MMIISLSEKTGFNVCVLFSFSPPPPPPSLLPHISHLCHTSTPTLSYTSPSPLFYSSVTPSLEQLTDCSNWTSSFSSRVAPMIMSHDTISWKDVVLNWFHSIPEELRQKSHLWDTMEPLFNKYIPPTLDFLSPALTGLTADRDHVAHSPIPVGAGLLRMEPQELKLCRIHLVNSCCLIFQVSMEYNHKEKRKKHKHECSQLSISIFSG